MVFQGRFANSVAMKFEGILFLLLSWGANRPRPISDGVQVVKFTTSTRRRLVAKVELGRVVGTPAALLSIEEAGQEAKFFLDKHASGDWGSVDAADAQANDEAIGSGGRILSVHGTLLGVEVWVLTEAEDDEGHRTATTILLPEEY